MAKHFVFGGKTDLSKDAIKQIESDRQQISKTAEEILEEKNLQRFAEDDNLTHVSGKVVVMVDMQFKNTHTFDDGSKIRLERGFNNFNRRESQPVNCVVISGENIQKGSEILVSHNALHETNRINDYKNSFETDGSDRIRYYSIPTYECFAWKDDKGVMRPLKGFQFGLRVFKKYSGFLLGIPPEIIKNVLFVTTGDLSGNVVNTLPFCDYEIIYQSERGVEESLIRFRHDDFEEIDREEVLCINHDLTDMVIAKDLLVGYSIKNCYEYDNK